jgi:uncharacterized protein YegP (UPF0339 family)
MSKLFRAAVLFAALGAVLAAGNLTSTAPAQETKKKKATKDDIGTTEVYKAKDGWRFKIMNSAGKSVAIGTVGFDTPEEAENMIEYVKNTLAKGKVNVSKDAKK